MNIKTGILKNIKIKHLLLLLACGILLLSLSHLGTRTEKVDSTIEEKRSDIILQRSEKQTEERLASIIAKIKGVSNVSVFITYENNGIYRTDSNIKENTSTDSSGTDFSKENSVVMKKNASAEEPFVNEETMPEIRGVLIVAGGVGNPAVNAEITDAVSTALGVAVHKVKILQAD